MKYYVLLTACLGFLIKRELSTTTTSLPTTTLDQTETVLLDGTFIGFVNSVETGTVSVQESEETPFELTLVTDLVVTTTNDVTTTTTDETTTTKETTTTDDIELTTATDIVDVTTTDVITKMTTSAEVSVETEIIQENFCESVGLGDSIADGTQNKSTTCSLTVLGAIPSFDRMISTIILSPKNNKKIKLGTSFNVTLISTNIEFGFFDDPTTSYYSSPQTLNKFGRIQGHTHVTIQKIENPFLPPAVQSPTFFKGLNDPSDTGILTTLVDGELFDSDGTGEYRICTLTSSRSHSAVLMPVARRGSQDDCIRINII